MRRPSRAAIFFSRWMVPILAVIGIYAVMGLVAWGISSAVEASKPFEESSALLDIVSQQNDIDNQYEHVLDDVTDIDRYNDLRYQIDRCFITVNQYNELRGEHWPPMSADRCDRIFP